MKKVLIIGSNSYIGNELCQYIDNQFIENCEVHKIGASNGEWKNKGFAGYDTILHVAAIVHKRESKLSEQIYNEINNELTINIAVKAKNSGVQQFIFLSTMAVYNNKVARITKNTLPCPNTLYGKSKLNAEIELKKMETENFRIAIVRPPMVYGEGCKGNYARLKKIARISPIFPRYNNVKSVINITSLCEILTNIILSDLNGIFFPQDNSYRSTYNLYSEIRSQNGKITLSFRILNILIFGMMRINKTIFKLFSNHYYDMEMPSGRMKRHESIRNVGIDPLVSVIIPTYNSAKYISKAINSVLLQNISHEIIIINDCSSDNIDQVMDLYLQFNNIIYLKNDINLGVAKSRNKGVSIARGKYIAFLDADDWWMPNKLEEQLKFMKQKDCVLSYTARQLVNDDESITGKVIQALEEVDYHKLLRHNVISCSSVVLTRQIALDYPMEKSEVHEDYLTWLRILTKFEKAYGINQPLLAYRLSKNGKTRNKLKSAKMTYGVYRELKISRAKSLLYMCSHQFYGIRKYYGIEG